MTRTVLVAPTGHSVGLTSVCLGLVAALDRAGVVVGFAKPIGQPRGARADPSAELVRLSSGRPTGATISTGRVEKLLGAGRLDELMQEVVAIVEPLSECDVVVVEGLVPAPDRVWSTRVDTAMASALDADVLLVADGGGGVGGGGDPSHLADRVALAAAPYRIGERLRVAGCVVNRVPDTSPGRLPGIAAALAHHGIELAGAVPLRADLTWPRTSDVVRELGARTLVTGDRSRRVAEVLVCAQAVPGLLPHLRDGCLLLVPGDRHDVVMAAGLAEMGGVRLAGLLLTAGVEPAPEVMRLTSAATGLLVLVVDEATYPTAVRLHDLNPELSVDDPERARAVADAVADALDPAWLHALPEPGRRHRLTPAAFGRHLVDRARAADARIVLPEGAEPRVVAAAVACAQRGIARPVLLATPAAVATTLRTLGLARPTGVDVVDPAAVGPRYVERLVALRAHKGMTAAVAQQRLTDPITVATMMLEAGEVDGLVAGAVHTTAATVRPALELIGAAAGVRLVSSVFFMCLPDEVVVYADCAVNPDPDADDLADIAVQSAATAADLGIDPRVAMISFSTGTSGSGADVDKVTEATRIARTLRPDLPIDGPLQYDAAAVASVGSSKRPGSTVAGRATVFVFPDLNTGNTTYKAVQRSADVVGIGPVLQGLARPVNDLSRGASVEDIVSTIALTAVQSGRWSPSRGTNAPWAAARDAGTLEAMAPVAPRVSLPDEATLVRVLEAAVRAPSVYNSQPWRWRTGTRSGIDLFADPDRHLTTIDADSRDLLLSCGAALQHLVVALAGLGWSARVDRFPDPEDSEHLAHVQPVAVPPPADLARLAAAIPRRRTDRRRFGAAPVDPAMLDTLVGCARDEGADLQVVTGGAARTQLIEIIARSATLQRQQAGYGAELARWTGRYGAAGDGIGAGTVASGVSRPGDVPMRHFTRGSLTQPTHSLEHDDASVLTVLSARSDDRPGTLRAGEAAGAVLLTATGMGLATTPLSQPLEVSATRDRISEHLVGSGLFPQLVIRVGRPDPQAAPLPPTPRRGIDHVRRRSP